MGVIILETTLLCDVAHASLLRDISYTDCKKLLGAKITACTGGPLPLEMTQKLSTLADTAIGGKVPEVALASDSGEYGATGNRYQHVILPQPRPRIQPCPCGGFVWFTVAVASLRRS